MLVVTGPSVRRALRQIMLREPRVRPVVGGAPLETLPSGLEPPRVLDAHIVEDATVNAHAVPCSGASEFVAFLDGSQRTRHVGQCGRAPIIEGTVTAAVRERVARRLVAWGAPEREVRLYVPFSFAPRAAFEAELPDSALRDTSVDEYGAAIDTSHPLLLIERARLQVSRDREAAERRLAEQWCTVENRPLFIDGGIGGSEIVARSTCAVGVVKSHHALYAADNALEVVLSLRRGERSSVIRIAPRGRTSVHSWYLRLRDPEGHDVLWGIVRVETAESAAPADRADEVSSWILAELTPNAMPDLRWDRMPYAIRNTEEFLRAIM